MKRRPFTRWCAAAAAVLIGCGCAIAPKQETSGAPPYRHTAQGTVVYEEEFEFAPPGKEWKLMRMVQGDEFAFAFFKSGGCPSPCQAVFAYDEDPFGYSQDLETRLAEFYRRFLWGARLSFGDITTRDLQVLGGEGLAAVAEGENQISGQKVMTKVVLGKRGDRVVSFYLSQWRPMDGAYDPGEVAEFDRFVQSFRFLKPSFYEKM